jgi:hypothetical protein
LGTGTKKFTILQFTTDDPKCPIESYQATGLSSGITADPACSSTSKTSAACKSVIVDITKLGTFDVKFIIKAKGDNQIESSSIMIAEVCPSSLKIIAPFISPQTIEFKQGEGPSTYEVGEFFTEIVECPIIRYKADLVDGITL